MEKLKLLVSILVLSVISLLLPNKIDAATASEGKVELRSVTNDSYRCYATSLELKSDNFKILVSCKDLIYPPTADLFSYVVWATSIKNGKPIKLGQLGIGRAEFTARDDFSDMYVTLETNPNNRTPSDSVVMRGNVEPIEFLVSPTTPTPTSTPSEEQPQETPAQTLTTGQRLTIGLRRAGLVALLALIAIVGLVFVVTRSRG